MTERKIRGQYPIGSTKVPKLEKKKSPQTFTYKLLSIGQLEKDGEVPVTLVDSRILGKSQTHKIDEQKHRKFFFGEMYTHAF